MKNKVLVITNSCDDAHADMFFATANNRNCIDAIRFNTDLFLSTCEVSFDGSEYSVSMLDSKKNFVSSSIRSVWYRRPVDPVTANNIEDPHAVDFCKQQSQAFLRSLYFSTHESALWVNPLPALHAARHKLTQLTLAKRLGIGIPRTLATNDIAKAIEFAKSCGQVCVKSLDEPHLTLGGKVQSFMTTPISINDLENYRDSFGLCPVYLQELLPKKADIRVVVIGDALFAVEIASQNHPASRVDFRAVSPELLEHRIHRLPNGVESTLRRYAKVQGLVFSAMDLILTPSDDYVFLENNPNGQWLWLEIYTGLKMMESMFELLVGPTPSRLPPSL